MNRRLIKPLNHDSIFYLGNIYDGIDEGHVRRLVEMYDPQKVGNERCSECGLDWFCSGGCAPNNYQIYGDVHRVPEMHCIWQKAIADSAYRIMQAMSLEQNSLFQRTFVNGVARGW